MYQLVAIGDITVDIFFQGKTLTQEKDRFNLAIGGKYYSDSFHHGLGGSAANVSIHAAQLGLDSAVVAKVGENAFKNMIVQHLARKTVSTEFLSFDRDHISISSVLLTPSGERTIVKYSDPKDHIYLGDHAVDRIMRSNIVFMGNLPDVSIIERAKVLKAVRSSENLIAINFGSRDCKKGVAKLKRLIIASDILFLNRFELAHLLGKKPEKLNLKKDMRKLLKVDVPLLVVTDSSCGSYAYAADNMYHEPAVKVKKVIDCTGAGDAFTTGFLAKYSDTKDVQASLTYASEFAAKILLRIGAN